MQILHIRKYISRNIPTKVKKQDSAYLIENQMVRIKRKSGFGCLERR